MKRTATTLALAAALLTATAGPALADSYSITGRTADGTRYSYSVTTTTSGTTTHADYSGRITSSSGLTARDRGSAVSTSGSGSYSGRITSSSGTSRRYSGWLSWLG